MVLDLKLYSPTNFMLDDFVYKAVNLPIPKCLWAAILQSFLQPQSFCCANVLGARGLCSLIPRPCVRGLGTRLWFVVYNSAHRHWVEHDRIVGITREIIWLSRVTYLVITACIIEYIKGIGNYLSSAPFLHLVDCTVYCFELSWWSFWFSVYS